MSIPGFEHRREPRDGSGPAPGDRFVPQHITCAEEYQSICENGCEGSWDPRCFRKCIDRYCLGPGPERW